MSVALHTGALAAEMFLQNRSADEYARRVNHDLRKSMRFATWLSRAMVTAVGQMIAPPLLSLLPGAMGHIASWTRIPDRALVLAPSAREFCLPSSP